MPTAPMASGSPAAVEAAEDEEEQDEQDRERQALGRADVLGGLLLIASLVGTSPPTWVLRPGAPRSDRWRRSCSAGPVSLAPCSSRTA